MEQCDALIVGGGPAGSTCAQRLTAAGMEVVVLDKHTFPRDKVCAGWVTPAVIEELDLDCDAYRQEHVLQPFHGFCTGMIGGQQVCTDYGQPVSYGIRRCEFDHYLLARSGARLQLGKPLSMFEYKQDRWIVNEEFSAPLLIGAGGHFCPIARTLGPKASSDEHIISAQEVEFLMTSQQIEQCTIDATRPELFFLSDLSGYGWCVRKGNYLNIGLGREGNHKLAQQVTEFQQWLVAQGKIPVDVPGKFHGHAYLLSIQKKPRPLIADNALLIGDACGLAYPQSGEGIRPAIESALLASDIILNAKGDYSREQLKPYEERIIARFGQRNAEGNGFSWLPQGMKNIAARTLLTSAWFSRHVLLDRWFLHRNQIAIQG